MDLGGAIWPLKSLTWVIWQELERKWEKKPTKIACFAQKLKSYLNGYRDPDVKCKLC